MSRWVSGQVASLGVFLSELVRIPEYNTEAHRRHRELRRRVGTVSEVDTRIETRGEARLRVAVPRPA